MDKRLLITGIVGVLLLACNAESVADRASVHKLIDAKAAPETQALFWNLHRLSRDHVLFGHQDTLAYGVNWVDMPGRSDARDVTGSYPAIYGWELGGLDLGAKENLDGVDFEKLKGWIHEAYRRGGVNTISWHMFDPVSGGRAWTRASVVPHILPGGAQHEKFKSALDTFVAFNESLQVKGADGRLHYIPIIFRPWHEHTGDWFWWGKGNATEEDFIRLWRFTVEYLRDKKNVHNLIYAISPDRSRIDIDRFKQDFLYAYPGDDYVDILGLDNYWDLGRRGNRASADEQKQNFKRSLQYTVEIALERNKLPALTETGLDTIHDARFWTGSLLAGILANDLTRQIAYLMVWRNTNRERENREHYYVPYPGHPSADDFKDFYKHPFVLFENELPDMYKQP